MNRGVIFMIENNELYSYEKEWLEKMLSTEFPHKEDIVKQINLAKISREYTDYYLRLKFIIQKENDKFPNNTGVPIEMRVYRDNETPIQFLLHIVRGNVSELEVFRADSSKISCEIAFKNAKIEIIIYYVGGLSDGK